LAAVASAFSVTLSASTLIGICLQGLLSALHPPEHANKALEICRRLLYLRVAVDMMLGAAASSAVLATTVSPGQAAISFAFDVHVSA
jgi:hypothetical protein